MDEEQYNNLFDRKMNPRYLSYFAGGSDCVDPGISPERIMEMLTGNAPKAEETDLTKKKNLTLAETMELLSRGLKPYYISYSQNQMVELTLDNEDERGLQIIHWLPPRIAEKIQDRYNRINAILKEKEDAISAYNSKIEDLKARIQDILDKGHDLML